MKNYIYIIIALLLAQVVIAQTPTTITKENTYTVTGTETLTATHSITLKPNTWIQSGSTFVAQIIEPTTATDPYTAITLTDENYVFTRSFQTAMTSFNAGTAKEGDVIEQIGYFDGLGRPMQTIGIKSAPDKKDILTHMEYDAYGRQDMDWLPYHEATGSVGAYRGDKATATQQYYQTNYAADFTGVTNTADITAYAQKRLETSPLSRVLEQGAPGEDWKVIANSNGDHTIKFEYASNTGSEIKQFRVTLATDYTPTLEIRSDNNGFYDADELYKTIIKDENWTTSDGTNHTTEEFKDKQGRLILKRTYGQSDTNMDGDTDDPGESNVTHDTYYVYDDYGNLSYVLPPKMSTANTTSANISTLRGQLNELGYQYIYDYRNRLVEKRIPGKDWEYVVYDDLDRPVLTQDANLRAANKWLFTKYDIFGRVVYTGVHASTSQTRAAMQSHVDTTNDLATELYESKVTSGTGHDNSYYTNNNFPNSNIELLTVNYYDNYYFDKDGLSLPSTADGQTVINYNDSNTILTKGLATGTRVKVLDTSNWITTLTGYDAKGRAIYAVSSNDYLNTTDVVISTLDFAGKVDKTTTTHDKTGHTTITTIDNFVYDHEGRLLRQKQIINSEAQETIVDNTYDDLGQLETKGVGGKSSVANRLQDVDYSYNVRGWLKDINNVSSLGSDLFAFRIKYNGSGSGTPLFNGNISETVWKTNNTDNSTKAYTYSYDALNRLVEAIDYTSKYNLKDVAYDKNGNITALLRKGHIVANPNINTPSDFGNMDNLTYTYDTGNKLKSVDDNFASDTYGFKDGVDIAVEYTYDANGNMIKDLNKGIEGPGGTDGILYNHLNLPVEVRFGSTNKIEYIYDATGVKLEKKVIESGKSNVYTFYAGNFVYGRTGDTGNGSLKFFNHAEGYVDTSNGYDYVYQYKDHLGNVRLSYQDIDNSDSVGSSEILEENNYYPFGLKHQGYNTNATSHIALNYKYNGVEFEEALGLDWYEMDVRGYDPAIARFNSIDPVEHHGLSPFNAFDNNPIFWADPSGADAWTYIGGGVYKNKRTSEETTDWQRAVGNTEGSNNSKGSEEKSPDDIIIRAYNPRTDYYETVAVIETKHYDVVFDVDLPIGEYNPITDTATNPKVISGFDKYVFLFGKPDAIKLTVTGDFAIGGGGGGAFDVVGFLNGPDSGSMFTYVPDDQSDLNFGFGAGVSMEAGFVYSNLDLRKFNKHTLEGYEMNASGSFGYWAASLFWGLRSSGNGYRPGKGPYHGFTFGVGYGTPAVMGTISKTKLYRESPALKN